MDRNTLTGFLLIGLILVTFNIFILPKDQPSAPEKAKIAAKAAPKAELKPVGTTPATNDSALSESLGPLAALGNGNAQLVQLSNDKITVTFSNKGATPVQVLVNNYKTFEGKPLMLFKPGANRLSYHYVAGNRNISTEQLYFQIDSSRSKSGNMVFTAALDEKRYIRHTYQLEKGSFQLKHQVQVVGLGGILAPNIDYTRLSWSTSAPRQEKDLKDERNTSTAYFRFSDEEPERIDYTDYETQELNTAVKWVSFKQKFFNTSLIAEQQFDNGKVTTVLPSTDSIVKEFNAELVLPLKNPDNQIHNLSFYFGPNDYATLKEFGIGLQEMIPLGWGIFGWVNKLIVINVFDWLDTSGLSYGLVILILTIIIKLILFPFTYKSYISSAKMRILKPEIGRFGVRIYRVVCPQEKRKKKP
jgi:YidC/Oxa1 family membrane protein insertase